jgi:hypothetical protein
MNKTVPLTVDAFSAGQIESKIWAAEELERVAAHTFNLRISILGGWYGLLHFILKSRGKQTIDWCRSYDLDPMACSVANVINNTWEMQDWKFRAIPKDANTLVYNDGTNCVINTSTEHFDSQEWFNNIIKGTLCVLQGNNLIIEDHVNRPESLEHFKSMFPLQTILFEGEKYFDFEKDSYTRYMIIGHK